MAEKTPFELEVERIIVDETERMFHRIDTAASRAGASDDEISNAIDRFGGHDLADAWADFVED